MNSKVIVGIVILLAALFAGYYLWNNSRNVTNQTSTPAPTNAQALEGNLDTPITTETDVNYFPEANGYFVMPEMTPPAGGFPGVVMIHENRGLRPEIKQMAENLAREGYMVLAVDLYKGQVVESQEEARALSQGFDQEEGIDNLQAAVQFLRDKGAEKVASLGWCFGGRQSVALSISGENLDATVVYYGSNMASTVEELRPINWPVLGVFGDEDQAIPLEKVEEFETSLNTLEIENEIYIYPGVGHAFANPSGANYAPEPTADAWEKTSQFLNKHLKS